MSYLTLRAVNGQTASYGPGSVVDPTRFSVDEFNGFVASGAIVSTAALTGIATALGLGAAATMTPAAIAADSALTDAFAPLPAGTAAVGQSPVVTAVSPLTLGWGAGSSPWQFPVEDYGAVADGRTVYDLVTTNTSAVVTSATATFDAARDAGKAFVAFGAGVAGADLITTISSVGSATQVTLAAAASASTTGTLADWGTDSTAGINAANAAAEAYIDANPFGLYAEVVFEPGTYLVMAAPINGGAAKACAQIPLPFRDRALKPKATLSWVGVQSAAWFSNGFQTVPPRNGTIIKSTLTHQSYNATYGLPAVVGTWTPEQGSGSGADFSNMLFHARGIVIVTPRNPSISGWDLCGVSQINLDMCGATADFPLTYAQVWSQPGKDSWGLRTPLTTNNAHQVITRFHACGFEFGVLAAEHMNAQEIAVICNAFGLTINGGGHAVYVASLIAEMNGSNISYLDGLGTVRETGSGGVLVIGKASTEGGTGSTWDINDSANLLYGEVGWAALNQAPRVNGAGNLNVRRIDVAAGPVTAPAVPATTVAHTNAFWRNCAVAVAGGTVTAIAVGGVATGLTSGMVIVPSGKTITLTYSSAPTWTWTLL